MHQTPHAAGLAGAGDLVGQLHMRFIESRFIALQDGHQVDYRVMTFHQALQRGGVVDAGLQHRERGQHGDGAGIRSLARWHRDLMAGTDELFAEVPADKAAATQNKYFFHVAILRQTLWPRWRFAKAVRRKAL